MNLGALNGSCRMEKLNIVLFWIVKYQQNVTTWKISIFCYITVWVFSLLAGERKEKLKQTQDGEKSEFDFSSAVYVFKFLRKSFALN